MYGLRKRAGLTSFLLLILYSTVTENTKTEGGYEIFSVHLPLYTSSIYTSISDSFNAASFLRIEFKW